ncbi:MAG: hypothetical protein CEE40_02370 [Chloroflexi bacterium B3_Chlor]|nr:MAG: hypothetical protein CEE40_02370 [Chloroflexi bacterium B3_Chlor]
MKKSLVLHPFLFAAFPVLFVFAHNMDQIRASMVPGPIVFTTFAAFLCWSLLSLVLRDGKRAGLIVSLFFLLFFSYGICHLAMKVLAARLLGRSTIVTPGHILIPWAILFALGTYSFAKTDRNLHNLTSIADIVAGCLVAVCVINIGAYELRSMSAWRGNGNTVDIETQPTYQEAGVLPDIYYIVLDGYARADVLEEIYDYDNTEFLDYLTAKGFYVAHESRSNYCMTLLSLASSLNSTYLDGLAQQIGGEYRGAGPVAGMIGDSKVFRFLRSHGYEIVAFASGYAGTEVGNADRYLAHRWYPDEFQVALINMTPLPVVLNALYDMHDWHRERILYTFEHLPDASELPGPTFVFAHIIAPHPPFVFGPNGERIDPELQFVLADGSHLIGKRGMTRDEYVAQYRGQLMFVNTQVRGAVDAILSTSQRPAIIVLQADHGPGSMLDWDDPDNANVEERLSVLNAYYLPGGGETHLYPGITPVNTFRVIFNHYFDADLELLEDESYFSTWGRPHAFINVTDGMDADADIVHGE